VHAESNPNRKTSKVFLTVFFLYSVDSRGSFGRTFQVCWPVSVEAPIRCLPQERAQRHDANASRALLLGSSHNVDLNAEFFVNRLQSVERFVDLPVPTNDLSTEQKQDEKDREQKYKRD
jgi:hypothetical protein